MFYQILLDHDGPHEDHEEYSTHAKSAGKYPKYNLQVADLPSSYTQIFSVGDPLHRHTP